MRDRLEPLDVYGVADTFATALAAVEDMGGGCWRFTFVTTHDIGGRHEEVVVAKLIMPGAALPDAMHMTGQITKTCACINARAMTRN